MTRWNRVPWSSAWPHLRVLVIGLHVIALVALALPHPAVVADRSRWDSNRGKMELASWGRTLRSAGISISDSELERRAWKWAKAYQAWHQRWVAPLWIYDKYLHQRQGWSMFTHPKKRVGKVWLEVDTGDGFRPIFVSKSASYDAYADIFTHNRMRKLFNRVTSHRYRAGMDEFAEWIRSRVERDYPTARRMRVRIENLDTPSPEAVRAGVVPPSRFTRTRVVDFEVAP